MKIMTPIIITAFIGLFLIVREQREQKKFKIFCKDQEDKNLFV